MYFLPVNCLSHNDLDLCLPKKQLLVFSVMGTVELMVLLLVWNVFPSMCVLYYELNVVSRTFLP